MSTTGDIDILMVTYERPHYTEKSLVQLLSTCTDSMRVWLWHNGEDQATLDVVRRYADHPRVHRFHHSVENVKLKEPTNWLWTHSEGAYVSKVDDDCVLPSGWAETLRAAHEANPKLGVVGCWRFQEEDFIPELAERKIQELAGGHSILRNCWVQGSGYLMKRECVEDLGLLKGLGSFSHHCNKLALRGWINGFYYPFIHEDHMDDPRSANSALRTDADLEQFAPIGAVLDGVRDLETWQERVLWNAFAVQVATVDPRWFGGWRARAHRIGVRLRWRKWRPRMVAAARAAGHSR